MPEIISATYQIVTPMFIGDADQKASGIAPASVKGALRFWWRALNWGRIRNTSESDETALTTLHQQEGELFGSAAEQGPGQSKFLLRIKQPPIWRKDNSWPQAQSNSGYLGMGLWESGNLSKGNYQAHRESLLENQSFEIQLASSRLKPEEKKVLTDTLILFGLLGGLGSRVRRGFGSIQLKMLNGIDYSCNDQEAYEAQIISVLAAYQSINMYPPFTAFSHKSSLSLVSKADNNARISHSNLGLSFKNHRGLPSGLRGSKKRVFGMPLAGAGYKAGNARRGSPLFFHIHEVAERQFISAILFLPSKPFHSDSSLDSVDYSLASNFLSIGNEIKLP